MLSLNAHKHLEDFENEHLQGSQTLFSILEEETEDRSCLIPSWKFDRQTELFLKHSYRQNDKTQANYPVALFA